MNRINRREFIRLASLMGGVSLFAGCSLFGEGAPVPRYIEGAPATDPVETLKGVQSIYSVCALCPGNCGISCRVAEGTLVKIGGSPYNPISAHPTLAFETPLDQAIRHSGSVCAIGSSGIQTLYDPFRVVKPLKRVGERGSGKWEAISWNQVMKEIVQGGDLFKEGPVTGLRQIKESREGLRVFLGRVDWGAMSFLKRFLAGFPSAEVMRDREAHLADLAKEVSESMFGSGTGPVAPDYRTARALISFGDAPLDSGIPLVSIARQIADARVTPSCLKWAVVDPRLSTSASKADLWVPVLPGKDLMLALGIMRSLFDRHAAQVRVMDQTLKAAAMSRSAKDCARESGVSIKTMDRLADMLVEGGERSAAIPGRGILGDKNGKDAAAAILTLNLMVGSVPGSGGLISRHDDFLNDALKTVMAGMQYEPKPSSSDTRTKALLLWEADPVYHDPARAAALLSNRKEVPLFVAVDRQITETTALADYILPDTTYLERWDVCALPPAVAAAGVGIRRPVVGGFDPAKREYFPIFAETRPMEEILIALAVNLKLPGFGEKGMGSAGNLNTAWDYYGRVIPAVLESMNNAGFPVTGSKEDLEKVTDRGGFFPTAGQARAAKPHGALIRFKPLDSLKVDAHNPQKSGMNSPADSSRGDDEFTLITYSLPFHRAPRAGINRWLLEVLPENRLLINTADARRLGLKQGDRVSIEMGDGKSHVSCRIQSLPGIKPGVVALAAGFGYQQCGVAPQTIDGNTRDTDKTPGAGLNAGMLISENRTVKLKKG